MPACKECGNVESFGEAIQGVREVSYDGTEPTVTDEDYETQYMFCLECGSSQIVMDDD